MREGTAASSRRSSPPELSPSTDDGAIALSSDTRIIAVGKTRSGKSTWFRQPEVLGSLERCVILDTKGEAPWIGFAKSMGYEIRNGEAAALAAIRDPEPPPKILARCFDPLGDLAAELCMELFRRPAQIGTAMFDECVHWCRGHEVNRGIRLIWTMGGGLGLGGFAGTQRPVDLWNGFLSESEHRIVFRLELRSDRAKLDDFIPGVMEQAAILDRYWWLYHSAGEFGSARLMRPVV